MNLTPRPITDTSEDPRGLSTFDAPERASPPKGGEFQVIDTGRLRTLITVEDSANPGHVTIRPESQEELDNWAASRGREDFVHPLTREVQQAIIDERRIRP
jgi:hypothetical protein